MEDLTLLLLGIIAIGIILFFVIVICLLNKHTRNEQDIIILESMLKRPASEKNMMACKRMIEEIDHSGLDSREYARFDKDVKVFNKKYGK